MDINTYIDNLPIDITKLDLKNRNLTYIPSLIKFTKLKELNCKNNKLELLPELPTSLQILNCSSNNLIEISETPLAVKYLDCSFNLLKQLPKLSDSIQIIICNDNKLKQLPKLPLDLINLNCSFNELESLPVLPPRLSILHCSYNQIYILPILPETLHDLKYVENPVYEIFKTVSIEKLRSKIKLIQKIRHLFYSFKYKKQFCYLLWYKIREPKLKIKYHPDNIKKLLDKFGYDLDANQFDKLFEVY